MEKKCENCKYCMPYDGKGICSVQLWIDGKLSVNRYVPLESKCEMFEEKEEPNENK